jgi:hypothetical protein
LLDRGHGRAPAEIAIKTDPRDMTNLERAQATLAYVDDSPEKLDAILAILDDGEKLVDGLAEIPADLDPPALNDP